MEDLPSIDAVYQGIHTLYNDPVPASKEEAGKWLEKLQKSVYSWKIADELLQQKRDLHACYFAALTMRNKIQNSFHELPSTSHNSLRDSLLVHVSQITPQTEQIIVTQLCLAVSDLALVMSAWQNPVLNLIEQFSHNPDSLWPLLEILSLIPEEINSRYLRLGANRRQEINKQLERNSGTVFEFLCACLKNTSNPAKFPTGNYHVSNSSLGNNITLNNNNNNGNHHDGAGQAREELIQSKVLKCFTSWVSIHAITVPDISENMIVSLAFSILANENGQNEVSTKMHDIASDCLCTLLQTLETPQSNKNQSQQLLELQLFSGVMSLEKAFQVSIVYENVDATVNYCRIFTVLGESFLERMVGDTETTADGNPHYSIKCLELVLKCVAHYDYEVARITFNLWYKLSEELYRRNNDTLTAHFKPYVEALIGELLRHSQMEPDFEGLIDENEAFFDFRRKVSELVKDVVFVVSSINCFKQMFVTLQEPTVTWEGTESALFIMSNVGKNILPEENEIVPKVVEAILNLPETTHIAVRYTSVMLLGELCDWIQQHSESLQAVLNFLLYSLQQKNGLAPAAAVALQSICSSCKDQMICHIDGLVQIARSLDSFEINNESAIGLLKGISTIVSRLDREQLTQAVREICSFQLQPLMQLLESNAEEKIELKGRRDPVFWLDRLSAILRHTNPTVRENDQHPLLSVLQEIWPIISNTFMKYQTDLRVMERTCRCVRYAIRCVGKQATPILEPLVKQIVHLYGVYQHPCFLYLGSILVDEFAKNSSCTQGLIDMLQAFIQPTFQILEVEDGLRNHPDTVDDFFRLCARYLQRSPVEFLQSAVVTPIMQCALLACTLDHRDANLSVMKFFGNLLDCGRSESNELMRHLVHQLIAAHGEAMMVNLLHASVFCLQTYMLSDVADVLIEMKMVDTVQFLRFLKIALEALPKKNSAGCVTVTQEQLNEFHESVTVAETPKALTQALKEFTRLYR